MPPRSSSIRATRCRTLRSDPSSSTVFSSSTTPNNLIYTRQIIAPIEAAKLTGKIGGASVAYLGAQDDEGSTLLGGGGHPFFNVVRVLQDVGSASQIGLVATDREDGGTFNRLAGVDARFAFANIYSLAVQGAASTTHSQGLATNGIATNGVQGAGPLWEAHFIRAGHTFGMDYNFTGIDPEFVAGSGFISRTGVAGMSLDHHLTLYGPQGGFFQTFTGDFSVNDTWVYRHLTAAESPEDRRWHFTGTATLFQGWQLGAAVYFETYGYDPSLYSTYYLAARRRARHDVHAFRRPAAHPQHGLRLHLQHAAVRQALGLDSLHLRPRREFLRVGVRRHREYGGDHQLAPDGSVAVGLHVLGQLLPPTFGRVARRKPTDPETGPGVPIVASHLSPPHRPVQRDPSG